MVCHSRAANFVLGISTAQLNRVHASSAGAVNQIEVFERLGLFEGNLPKRPDEMQRLAAIDDETADVDRRARSYLHANCSFCHVDAGGGNSAVNFEIVAKPAEARLVDGRPVHTTFEIADARIVASGAPERSLVLYRMDRRGRGQMPPLASTIVDERAVALLREWIASLPPTGE